jgi:hypothetical protein
VSLSRVNSITSQSIPYIYFLIHITFHHSTLRPITYAVNKVVLSKETTTNHYLKQGSGLASFILASEKKNNLPYRLHDFVLLDTG